MITIYSSTFICGLTSVVLGIIQKYSVGSCMEDSPKEDPLSPSDRQQILLYNNPQQKYTENEISSYIKDDFQQRKRRFVLKFNKQNLKDPRLWILKGRQISKSKWFLKVTLPSLLILISLICGIVLCGLWFVSPSQNVYLTYFEKGREDHTTTIQVVSS